MEFREKYGFLSNFYENPIIYNGLQYRCAEAAFQAQKVTPGCNIDQFTKMTGSQAKKAGRFVLLRSDWEEVKENIMRDIIKAKFTQNKNLARKLIDIKEPIVEENSWGDTEWGVDIKTGQGENKLGKILMEVRDFLLSDEASKIIKVGDIVWYRDATFDAPKVAIVDNIFPEEEISEVIWVRLYSNKKLFNKYDGEYITRGIRFMPMTELFKSLDECNKYIKRRNVNIRNHYRSLIETKDDLIKFLYNNIGQEFDSNADVVIKEKAKEFGIVLE